MALRFGKLAPRLDKRTLRLSSFLEKKIAAPPPDFNALTRVYSNLKTNNAASLFPMDGNDNLGDCTIAAVAHADTVYQGLVSRRSVMTAPTVISLYEKLTGGPDTGLVELDVLNYWRKNLVNGDELFAYVSVDPRKHDHVKQAIKLFGGVYLGFTVPVDCIQRFEAGLPWVAGPLTNDGHAVFATGYSPRTVTVLTWGATQMGTWGWWDQCVDECYALLPPEAKLPNFAPGFNMQALEAALAAVTG